MESTIRDQSVETQKPDTSKQYVMLVEDGATATQDIEPSNKTDKIEIKECDIDESSNVEIQTIEMEDIHKMNISADGKAYLDIDEDSDVEESTNATPETVPNELQFFEGKNEDHQGRLAQSLWEQRACASVYCDVQIQVNDEKYLAHAAVLCASSAYLAQVLNIADVIQTQYPDGRVSSIRDLKIEGYSPQIVLKILEYMYTGHVEVNSENLDELLNLAESLHIDGMKLFCFSTLLKKMTCKNWSHLMKVFKNYNLAELELKVQVFCSKFISSIGGSSEFQELELPALEIVLADCNPTNSPDVEQAKLLAIWNWVLGNTEERMEFYKELLSTVNSDLLDLDKISEIKNDMYDSFRDRPLTVRLLADIAKNSLSRTRTRIKPESSCGVPEESPDEDNAMADDWSPLGTEIKQEISDDIPASPKRQKRSPRGKLEIDTTQKTKKPRGRPPKQMNQASKPKLPKILSMCGSTSFKELSLTMLQAILSDCNPTKSPDIEQSKLMAIWNWVCAKSDNRMEFYENLLTMINFESLDVSKISELMDDDAFFDKPLTVKMLADIAKNHLLGRHETLGQGADKQPKKDIKTEVGAEASLVGSPRGRGKPHKEDENVGPQQTASNQRRQAGGIKKKKVPTATLR